VTAKQRETVDRLGALDAKLIPALAKLKPDLDEQKRLRAEVTSWAEDEPAASSPTYAGEHYTAIASPRRNEKSPNVPKLIKRFTLAALMPKLSILMKDLKELLTAEELSDYVTTEQTGYRTVETVARVAKAA